MTTTTISTDIYSRLTFIGHLTERDKGQRCEAFSAAGTAIGVFTSPAKAARAVYEADRDQQHELAA